MKDRASLVVVSMFALAALGACGSSPAGGDPDAAPDAGGPARERIGGVEVIETRAIFESDGGPDEQRASQVYAEFFEDRGPSFHRVEATSGACVLKRYTPSLCDPVCAGGLCVAPDVCEPWPTRISAGAVTVTGLAVPIAMSPEPGGYYYPAGGTPEDLFADDATVTAELAGDDLPAASLTARGVPPLVPDITDRIVLVPGSDHTVTWTPAGAGRVRLTLNSDNVGHGNPYLAIIECDVDDSAGSITIAAALVDVFPETRAWSVCAGSDCPPSSLRRYRSAAAAVGADQEVRLVVASQFTFGVDHILPD